MSSNSLGQLFRITTWGESHGPAIGVVIDGCPAGLDLTEEDIWEVLKKRAPGLSPYTTPRQEKDQPKILSGIFEGVTTGTPISIIIYNHDVKSQHYEPIKNYLRPGHAQFSYLEKYGVYDYRGGGRASARETACRVAASAVAKKILSLEGISIQAELVEVGGKRVVSQDMLFQYLDKVIQQQDSVGGVVSFNISGVPCGLGDPIYEKLEANLAKAMMSIPASKGFEIGDGFYSAAMNGSSHNDTYAKQGDKITPTSNHAGGLLAGISTGQNIYGRVAFKPTSSIGKAQKTCDLLGQEVEFKLPEGSRHDPCVAIRAVPVVEAMCALVLVDAILMNRVSRI